MKVIEEYQLCPFCLMHNANSECYGQKGKIMDRKPCTKPGCKRDHIEALHKLLTEHLAVVNVVSRARVDEEEEEETYVNVVRTEDGWRTPPPGWLSMPGLSEDEEFVGLVMDRYMDGEEK